MTAKPAAGGRSLVDWGPTGVRRSNEWVTTAALAALSASADAKADHA